MEIPSQAISYGSTHADVSPGNFHDISCLLIISALCKRCIRADKCMIYDKLQYWAYHRLTMSSCSLTAMPPIQRPHRSDGNPSASSSLQNCVRISLVCLASSLYPDKHIGTGANTFVLSSIVLS